MDAELSKAAFLNYDGDYCSEKNWGLTGTEKAV